ncbi:PEP_CTERM-anchored TLD domain-containing protein [Pseudoduganella rhizocola]|uniref:PEP_CTERM-anchored TLD domain-containing protein n=1 Tax=Pseudoduganella rhizocola TaxID=3382643 RepID=UPI0038B6580A
MQHSAKGLAGVLLAGLLLAPFTSVHADSSLLTAANRSQLQTWLGQGDLALTNIYTKQAGHTAADFHQAVDGKGRTFSIMEATNAQGETFIVGGYNPASWQSSGGFNMTPEDRDRTAFLFNLSTGSLHRQTLKNFVFDTLGAYQTYNAANYGPTFGWGHDLFVPNDLTNGGISLLYSYIEPDGSHFNTSLLDGTPYVSPNITFGAMEIYLINAVPEPSAYGMLAAGLAVAGVAARRRRGKA